MEEILIGTTDRTILVFIPDSASTTGAGKTALAHSAITVSYTRVETDNDVVNTDVTSSMNALTNLTDAHNDWGWKEVSATLSPGLYRLDIADAVFATGAWYGVVQVQVTSGLAAATPKAFKLVAHDPADLGTKQSGDSYARIGAPVGASISADVAGVQSDTNDIQTRLPAALVGGRMDSNMQAAANGVITAAVIADGAIDAATFAAGAITAAAIATDAIDADAIAADAVTEIQSGLSTLTAAGVRTAVGLAAANLDTQLAAVAAFIDTEVAAILAAVDTEVAAIKAKTDSLTFTVAGQVDANIQYVNDVQVKGVGTPADPWNPV